jgi:hypothetical protein
MIPTIPYKKVRGQRSKVRGRSRGGDEASRATVAKGAGIAVEFRVP